MIRYFCDICGDEIEGTKHGGFSARESEAGALQVQVQARVVGSGSDASRVCNLCIVKEVVRLYNAEGAASGKAVKIVEPSAPIPAGYRGTVQSLAEAKGRVPK